LHEDHIFRPNITADSADQLGASLTLRTQRGIRSRAAAVDRRCHARRRRGTYRFGRASSTVRLAAPLGPNLATAVRAGRRHRGRRRAGSELLVPRGPGTLRGYGGNASRGDAFWRARLELANRWPAARVVLFADVGRAGPREQLSIARALAGVGVGASFIDGLIRLDSARRPDSDGLASGFLYRRSALICAVALLTSSLSTH